MKRRNKTNAKKTRSRKPAAFKRHRTSTSPGLPTKRAYEQLRRELDEAREQQAATGDLLKVISRSTFDLQNVLDTLLKSAAGLCEADHSFIFLRQADGYRCASGSGEIPEWIEYLKQQTIRPGRGTIAARALLEMQTVHIRDVLADPEYTFLEAQRRGGYRTALGVPLLREGTAVGVMVLTRPTVRPFNVNQIALVTTFADQAVIAIENVRLFEAEQHRSRDLSEALEQQTATSEVLSVISSSRGDLAPVFHAILENAVRICEATFGSMLLREGDVFRRAALHNAPPQFEKFNKNVPILRRGMAPSVDHAIDTGQVSHTLDAAAEEPNAPIARYAGARTLLDVPMLKGNEAIGILGIYRREVRPFTDREIELVANFAAQAVIAIENARLLNELRQRTDDLTESLEQQTATSEVLRVISSSPGALEPVFQAMLENAVRICDAKFGIMWRHDSEAFDPVALFGAPEGLAEFVRQRGSFQPSAGTALDLILRTKDVVRISDAMTEPALGTARRGGARSLIIVPMLKDNVLIGAITIYRQEVRPFTDKQVELIKNFAAQAVIAIENARLLKELRERTDQLEVQSQEIVKLNRHLEQRVANQVGEIERMSRLRRFLPPQVADLIVASGTEKQLESHRREITALFCDLRGFTGFSESSDPEDVMALLREYHEAIGQIIFKYGGTLERFAGDGVMVIFNDPVLVENPALQAVLMALDMRTAIGGLIEKWRDLGHDLGFGIGIAHGFATLGTIGFEGRRDYAAIGTVSNVASRLCDEAKPGQILISPRVRQAVEKAVMVEPVCEFTLKGIRRPMLAYNVLESSPYKPN